MTPQMWTLAIIFGSVILYTIAWRYILPARLTGREPDLNTKET